MTDHSTYVADDAIMDLSYFKPTPLATRTARLNHANKWHAWAQFHIPDAYEGLAPELRAMHERVTVEDKSPMHWYSISGRDAVKFLNHMLPRDLTNLEIAAYVTASSDDLASPFELGLGRLMNFAKPDTFIGKQALLDEQAAGGPPRQLVGLEVHWRDIVELYEAAGAAPEISRRIDYRHHVLTHEGAFVGKASSL